MPRRFGDELFRAYAALPQPSPRKALGRLAAVLRREIEGAP